MTEPTSSVRDRIVKLLAEFNLIPYFEDMSKEDLEKACAPELPVEIEKIIVKERQSAREELFEQWKDEVYSLKLKPTEGTPATVALLTQSFRKVVNKKDI